jgi:hypothetical protein
VNKFGQLVEDRREGPKPLTIVFPFFENKTNQATKATREEVSEYRESGFLALHKESTIPRWSRCYHPIIYRINW